MVKFNELKFKELPDMSGVYCRIMFENGFGASIVKHKYSYGGDKGLYEIAVLDNIDGGPIYYTSVTDDVLGHLSENDVETHLNEIKNLNPNEAENNIH
jgi:hypothetical protein